ncbi:MAG: hypothetical protein HQ465_23200, partial [Rhodospirillales bacterium]|nr:hypothetical protein [Rhodospirillales bacterium]
TPIPQKTLIELLVVIAIIAVKTDGTPVVFTGSVRASDVKTLKADLRIGRDGNAMAVDWGNGPQPPQVLPRTGTATLTVPGPNGPIPLDPALVTALQVNARNSAPGMVDANTALQEVSATQLGSSQGNAGSGGPGTPTAQEQTISTSRSNIKQGSHGLAIIPNVGGTATGPGGVMKVRSDSGGWTRFGKLSIGNTVIEFNGADLASALKASVGPNTPIPQKTLIELLVVIAIIAVNTDGTPVVFTRSVRASDVKTVTADLRIGRNSNAMTVDWGNGPQLPQVLPLNGGTISGTLGGAGAYSNSTTVNEGTLQALQGIARQAKPGEVFAFSGLQEADTPR